MKPALKKQTREYHKELLDQAFKLSQEGMKQYDIAEVLGITPQYLSTLKHTYGLTVLTNTAVEQGIDLKKVTGYWYKGEQVSIHVKGDGQVTYDDIRDELIEEMKAHAPKYPKIEYTDRGRDYLLVLDPADVHIGKLATLAGTGEEYNHDIALSRLHEGVDGILELTKGFPKQEIVLVVGNDILHVDTPNNTTTKGTFQNMSTTWYEAFKMARMAYVEIVERLLPIAPVKVVFNPSNHDLMSGYALADALYCWFSKTPNIEFDIDMRDRKYLQFGTNLICTAHGDGAKELDYPYLMASEAKKLWADTDHRYIYLHHIHHKKKIKWQSGKDYHGVNVEYLRSPSSADDWHDKKGYTQVPKAIEAFVHHREYGRVGSFTHYF